jgi:hypothetical protein
MRTVVLALVLDVGAMGKDLVTWPNENKMSYGYRRRGLAHTFYFLISLF